MYLYYNTRIVLEISVLANFKAPKMLRNIFLWDYTSGPTISSIKRCNFNGDCSINWCDTFYCIYNYKNNYNYVLTIIISINVHVCFTSLLNTLTHH